MKQMRKKNVNLILSHMNPTFLLIGHSNVFKHTHCTFIIYMKKGSIQGLNLFQLSQIGPWNFGAWTIHIGCDKLCHKMDGGKNIANEHNNNHN
jgi:hypothetical protein